MTTADGTNPAPPSILIHSRYQYIFTLHLYIYIYTYTRISTVLPMLLVYSIQPDAGSISLTVFEGLCSIITAEKTQAEALRKGCWGFRSCLDGVYRAWCLGPLAGIASG